MQVITEIEIEIRNKKYIITINSKADRMKEMMKKNMRANLDLLRNTLISIRMEFVKEMKIAVILELCIYDTLRDEVREVFETHLDQTSRKVLLFLLCSHVRVVSSIDVVERNDPEMQCVI